MCHSFSRFFRMNSLRVRLYIQILTLIQMNKTLKRFDMYRINRILIQMFCLDLQLQKLILSFQFWYSLNLIHYYDTIIPHLILLAHMKNTLVPENTCLNRNKYHIQKHIRITTNKIYIKLLKKKVGRNYRYNNFILTCAK